MTVFYVDGNSGSNGAPGTSDAPLNEPEPAPDLEPLFVALAEKLQALQGKIGLIGFAVADAVECLGDVGAAYVDLWNAYEDGQQ
jgi:hypothetical protein